MKFETRLLSLLFTPKKLCFSALVHKSQINFNINCLVSGQPKNLTLVRLMTEGIIKLKKTIFFSKNTKIFIYYLNW